MTLQRSVIFFRESKLVNGKPSATLLQQCRHRSVHALQWRHNECDGVWITSLLIVYSTIYSLTDQRKQQSVVLLAFVRGIHRWPVNSPHKGWATPKMFPFDDVITDWYILAHTLEFSDGTRSIPWQMSFLSPSHREPFYIEYKVWPGSRLLRGGISLNCLRHPGVEKFELITLQYGSQKTSPSGDYSKCCKCICNPVNML